MIHFINLEYKHNRLTFTYSIYCSSTHLPFVTGSALPKASPKPATWAGILGTYFTGHESCCRKLGRERKPEL